MKRKPSFLVVLAVALLLSSCGSSKDFVYLQDMELGKSYPYDTKYEAVVHANDRATAVEGFQHHVPVTLALLQIRLEMRAA